MFSIQHSITKKLWNDHVLRTRANWEGGEALPVGRRGGGSGMLKLKVLLGGEGDVVVQEQHKLGHHVSRSWSNLH